MAKSDKPGTEHSLGVSRVFRSYTGLDSDPVKQAEEPTQPHPEGQGERHPSTDPEAVKVQAEAVAEVLEEKPSGTKPTKKSTAKKSTAKKSTPSKNG